MSSGELILVGIATAVGTIALALMLSRIVHVLVAVARTGGAPRAQPTVARRPRASPAPPARRGAVGAEARPAEPGGRMRKKRTAPARPQPAAAVPAQPAARADSGASRPVEHDAEAAPPPQPLPPSQPEVPSVRTPPERSLDVKRLRQSTVDRGEEGAGQPAGTDGDAGVTEESAAYRQVGEDVAEVLTAAERTAARIRASARQEADEIRADAEESAAATLAAAEARQAEVEKYDNEMRAAADSYSETTRRKSDEEAAKRVAKAEEQAREIRARAEKKAREIEAEAIRHRDELVKQTEGMELRIKSMLGTFREAATDLEGLLPTEETRSAAEERRAAAEERRAADEAELSPDDELAEALTPQRPQS